MQEPEMNSLSKLDKLISLINNSMPDRRDRSIKLLLNKIELDLIPSNVLYTYYHHIISESLIFLNQFHNASDNKVKMNILKILKHFTNDQEGKNLLKQYGVLEFMSEYYNFNMAEGGQILGPYIKGIIEQLVDNNRGGKIQNAITSDIEKKPVSVQNKLQEFYHHRMIYTNLLDLGDEPLDARFTESDVKLVETDRSAIINISTQLKFLSKENLNCQNTVTKELIGLVRNLPLEVYFNQFTELFYEVCNIMVTTEDNALRLQFYNTLIENLIKNISVRNFIEPPIDRSSRKVENLRGEGCVYPSLVKAPDNLKKAKLTLEGFIECLLRLNISFLINKDHAASRHLFNKLIGFLALHYQASLAFRRLLVAYLDHLNNYYVKSGLLFKELRVDQIIVSMHICEVLELVIKPNALEHGTLDLRHNWTISILVPQLAAFNLIPSSCFERLMANLKEVNPDTHKKLLNVKINREGHTKLDLSEPFLDFTTNVYPEKLLDIITNKVKMCVKYKLVNQLHSLNHISIDNVILLLVSVNYFLTEGKDKLSTQEGLFNDFNRCFIEFLSLLFIQKKHENSNSQNLIKKLTDTIKEQKTLEFSPLFSIESTTVLFNIFKSIRLLDLVLQTAIETRDVSVNDEPVINLLNVVIECYYSTDCILDQFSLCNFLLTSENHKAKALLEFLKAKDPTIRDITNFYSLFGYDSAKAMKAYEDLLIVSKIQPYGTESRPDSQLLLKVINYEEKQLKVVPQHILLRSLSKTNEYLTKADLKDLYDILNIFVDDNITKNVRLSSLDQLYTIITTYAQNPELIELVACIVNIVIEKLPSETDYDIMLYYIKLMNVFFLNFGYMKPLKAKLLNNSCICRDKENFDLFKRILGYLTINDGQNNVTILTFLQMLIFNANREIDAIKSTKSNCYNQLNDSNSADAENLKTIMNLKIFSYNIDYYFNLFSESTVSYTDLIYDVYNYDKVLLSSLADVSTNKDPETFMKDYLDVRIKSGVNTQNSTGAAIEKLNELNYATTVMKEFNLLKNFREEIVERYESVLNELLEIIMAGYDELVQRIGMTIHNFVVVLQKIPDKANELSFVKEVLVKFQREVHDCLLISSTSSNKRVDLCFLNQMANLRSLNNEKLAHVAFSKASNHEFPLTVSIFANSSAEMQNQLFFLFIEKAVDFMAANNKSLYTVNATIAQLLRSINSILIDVTDMDVSFLFNFLVQVKRYLESPILELKHLAFNILYNLSRFIKAGNSELTNELALRASMILNGNLELESPKIVSVCIALYSKLSKLSDDSHTNFTEVMSKLHIHIIKNSHSNDKHLIANYLRLLSIGCSSKNIDNKAKLVNETLASINIDLNCNYMSYLTFIKELLLLLDSHIESIKQKPTVVEKLLDITNTLTAEEMFIKTERNPKLHSETCFTAFYLLRHLVQTSTQALSLIENISKYLKLCSVEDATIKSHVYNILLQFLSSRPTLVKGTKEFFNKSLIVESIMQHIQSQLKEGDYSCFDFILPCLFYQTNLAKTIFVQKPIYMEIKNYVNKMMKLNDKRQVLQFLKNLRYFFLPLKKNDLGNCDTDAWTMMLDLIYNIIKKLMDSSDKEIYKPEILKILRNWYLNDDLNYYLEKLSQISKNKVVSQFFETYKASKQFNTSDFVNSTKFIRKTVGSTFFRTAVYKNKILPKITAILVDIYNKRSKNDNTKLIELLFDVLYAYSFYKLSHDKIISNKEDFEAISHFSFKCDDAYNTALVGSKGENSNKPVSKAELDFLYSATIKYAKFWTKLVLSKNIKSICLDNRLLVNRLREKLSLSNKAEEISVLTQFFINIIYKDASAFILFDKEEFIQEIEAVRYDNEKKLDKLRLLSEDRRKENNKMMEHCRKIEKNSRNLLNILSLS